MRSYLVTFQTIHGNVKMLQKASGAKSAESIMKLRFDHGWGFRAQLWSENL
jgi:hypothetical protein